VRKFPVIALVMALAVAGAPVLAGEPGSKAGSTVEEGTKTGGRAVRDGALTFGRSTRAFFKGGTKAARETWNPNAQHTAETAKAGGRATRDAAHGGDAKAAE
jgi:hypothetical protein